MTWILFRFYTAEWQSYLHRGSKWLRTHLLPSRKSHELQMVSVKILSVYMDLLSTTMEERYNFRSQPRIVLLCYFLSLFYSRSISQKEILESSHGLPYGLPYGLTDRTLTLSKADRLIRCAINPRFLVTVWYRQKSNCRSGGTERVNASPNSQALQSFTKSNT